VCLPQLDQKTGTIPGTSIFGHLWKLWSLLTTLSGQLSSSFPFTYASNFHQETPSFFDLRSSPIHNSVVFLPFPTAIWRRIQVSLSLEFFAMAQARETAFNPPSPHSSSGGADSYKHDGTPDTRLTAFSPDENSARSNKLLKPVNLDTPSGSNTVHFHVKSEGYPAAPGSAEKDPFVSSSSRSKAEQKLSPTASAFRPVTIPLVANGSLAGPSGFGISQPSAAQQLNLSVGNRFSTELGLSRYIALSAPSRPITTGDVDNYFEVCLGSDRFLDHDLGLTFHCRNLRTTSESHAKANAVYSPTRVKSTFASRMSNTPALFLNASHSTMWNGSLSTFRRPTSTE